MGLDKYVTVADRLAKARSDHKSLVVKTEVTLNFEKEAALIKATIEVEGKVVAVQHALAPALGDEKEFEKAETTAVGRALAVMGYPAEETGEDETPAKSSSKKSGLGGGLGKKSSAPKSAPKGEVEEEEEESEEESSEEEAEEQAPPAKKGGLPKLSSKKVEKDEEVEEESEEEEEASEGSDESEEEEEEQQAPPKKTGTSPKLQGVMAKYGLKK